MYNMNGEERVKIDINYHMNASRRPIVELRAWKHRGGVLRWNVFKWLNLENIVLEFCGDKLFCFGKCVRYSEVSYLL